MKDQTNHNDDNYHQLQLGSVQLERSEQSDGGEWQEEDGIVRFVFVFVSIFVSIFVSVFVSVCELVFVSVVVSIFVSVLQSVFVSVFVLVLQLVFVSVFDIVTVQAHIDFPS